MKSGQHQQHRQSGHSVREIPVHNHKGIHGLPRLVPFLWSVRFRLTLWYTALLAVILAGFSATVYLVLANSLYTGQDSLLTARAAQIATTVNISNGHIVLQEQDENGASVFMADEVMLLVDAQGRIVSRAGSLSPDDSANLAAHAGRTTATTLGTAVLTFAPQGAAPSVSDYRFAFLPLNDAGQRAGTLLVGRSRETIEEALHGLLLIVLLIAPVALGISALGGYGLASRAMRPVQTITRTARDIGETDLSRRLALKGRDELAELATTFDAMLARLENAFARQKQFTADASHELRTPLTIVALEVTRALSYARTADEYKHAMAVIQTENGHMTHLVNDLLLLARADAGQALLRRVPLDVSGLVADVVERLAPVAHLKAINLAVDSLPEIAVAGDSVYLTRLLLNVVENAITYTAGFGDRVTLATGVTPDKRAWVKIVDNGPGIAPTHLPSVFDRFYRIDRAREAVAGEDDPQAYGTSSGSGLGLSIVQWIAQAHGGTVTIESRVGTGTTVTLWLPLSGDLGSQSEQRHHPYTIAHNQ